MIQTGRSYDGTWSFPNIMFLVSLAKARRHLAEYCEHYAAILAGRPLRKAIWQNEAGRYMYSVSQEAFKIHARYYDLVEEL